MRLRHVLLIATLLLAAPSAAQAEGVPTSCPGDPISVTKTITGEFTTAQQGSYVLVPFDVPAGTTSVRVKYCYDQPAGGTQRHTIDLGLYQPPSGAVDWEKQFRGWGGSSHPDVTITPQGFSTNEQYLASPKGHVDGRTTRGYIPGPIPAGTWDAELGVAAVVPQADGDQDGKVAWRVEIELSSNPAFAADPYKPAPYDTEPARGQGWYQGDLHVHAEHSALGDVTDKALFDYAFGKAGLDFLTLTDYVTSSGWGEVGRYQSDYKGKLIARSAEIITYRGHTANQVSHRYVDYRTGPVYLRAADGSLSQVLPARPASRIFDEVHKAGGWTQVNHPTIFPSNTSANRTACRGCPWDYTDAETQWKKVDAMEVDTGPGGFAGADGQITTPNPFTATAISKWADLRRRGFPITAIGVSDSHHGGTVDGPTGSPVGNARTVVYADELSEDGVRRAVQAGHAYVKVFGLSSPDIRFTGTSGGRVAIMGDNLPDRTAKLAATITGAKGMTLALMRDTKKIALTDITSNSFRYAYNAKLRGQYWLDVYEPATNVHQAIANPITVGKAPRPIPAGIAAGGGKAALRVSARPSKGAADGKKRAYTFTVRSNGGAVLDGVKVSFLGASGLTDSRGRVTILAKAPSRAGAKVVSATAKSWRKATAKVTFR
jgi:hypothetical protein